MWLWRLLATLNAVDPDAARPYARRWQSDEHFAHAARSWFEEIAVDADK